MPNMLSSPQQSGNEGGSGPGRKRWSLATAFISNKKTSNFDTNAFPGSSPSFSDPAISDLQQLQKYTLKIKNLSKNVNHVDSAWNEYIKHKEKCLEWCRVLITPPLQRRQSSAVSPTTLVPPRSEYQRDGSLDTLNLVTVETSSSTQTNGSRVDSPLHPISHEEQYQKAAREWETAVKLLASTLRASLQETYNEYDKDATVDGFDRLCTDKAVRRTAIYHMRNASISKMMSADLDFFPKYDIRFRNYDEIRKDLAKVGLLLGTSSIPQSRTIVERRISPTGDVVLEFANVESEKHPAFRFRVASHCLRETSSPIFGHMFSAHFRTVLDDDIRRSLPSLPPSRHVCSDGSEVKLYRMPQTELNSERSLETLLHAAHGHHDRVPQTVRFEQFAAIAEVCLRYQCTSPLELAVEHRWLPQWRDNARDDMFSEALLISYVFGLPENFTHLSRIAILNMAGANYMQCRSWPHHVEEKIEAVRLAKIEQVYEYCRATLNEYLCLTPTIDPMSSTDRSHAAPSSKLRCPRGDPACDAQNLGWYMKSLSELRMLSTISPALPRAPAPQPQSLQEIFDALCLMTSPPLCHGGICDFAPSFRAAIRDIYESVSGLTLFDVSGKHGWALSKLRSPRHSVQSQNNGAVNEQLFKIAEQRYEPRDHRHYHGSTSVLQEHGRNGSQDDSDVCYFKILSLLDDPQDLRAAAQVSKPFYRSYLRNEAQLLAGIRGPVAGKAPATRYRSDIAEVDGSPCRTRADSGVGVLGPGDATPQQEKFKLGQLVVVEDKRLVETDANKYAGDIRERLLELRAQDGEGGGQSAHAMR